jgi:hypothetical protein
LTVALLLESETMDVWKAAAIQRLVSMPQVEPELIVLNRNPFRLVDQGPAYFLEKLLTRTAWVPIFAWERLRRRLLGPPSYREQRHLSSIDGLDEVERVGCEPIHLDFGVEFPDEVVEELAERVDLAFLFGFGIVRGDVLQAPSMGVLGIHHGDIREYRGRPVGFWELLDGRDAVGMTLQRISETLDGGEIVAFDTIPIHPHDTWQDVKERLYGPATADLLVSGVDNLLDPTFEPDNPDDELGPLYTLPGFVDVGRYLAINNYRRLRKLLGGSTGRGRADP